MIGPNDKRRLTTRCSDCAKRRIKCHGGFPCANCIRTGKNCLPPAAVTTSQDLVIVQTYSNSNTKHLATNNLNISPTVPLDSETKLSGHFFTVFVRRNDFLPRRYLEVAQIGRQSHACESLRCAVLAVAALDRSRAVNSDVWIGSEEKQWRTEVKVALVAYRRAVLALQGDIEKGSVLTCDASLWSTFLLGIFELMYDITGEGWVKHILYGTSKILQLRGPAAHVSGAGRSFFLTARVFEICRALIYNDDTFLDKKEWKGLMMMFWNGDVASDWHPIEGLFDIMVDCCTLSMRGHGLDDETLPLDQDELLNIANEGLRIQSCLLSWTDTMAAWRSPSSLKADSASILAQLYFHATLIFLSGIFDYRTYWPNIPTPTLSQHDVQKHVSTILQGVNAALKTTNLAGILFFFPLRVAGARARTIQEQRFILSFLEGIRRRNFVVAGAFVEDLSSLWGSRDVVDVS